MSWFSILPQSIIFIETIALRTFVCNTQSLPKSNANCALQLFLGVIVIGPWLLLIVYDAVLYIFRVATYDIPYIGGRARNRPRPRAPSLSERPNGKERPRMGLPAVISGDIAEGSGDGVKRRHERHSSSAVVDD